MDTATKDDVIDLLTAVQEQNEHLEQFLVAVKHVGLGSRLANAAMNLRNSTAAVNSQIELLMLEID